MNAVTPQEIIKYPLSTEKSIRHVEFNNTILFVVHPRATKIDVKRAVEELYKVKVKSVNMDNSIDGRKKAYVKLTSEHSASDLSADMGLL